MLSIELAISFILLFSVFSFVEQSSNTVLSTLVPLKDISSVPPSPILPRPLEFIVSSELVLEPIRDLTDELSLLEKHIPSI